jgi:hypothetical protein
VPAKSNSHPTEEQHPQCWQTARLQVCSDRAVSSNNSADSYLKLQFHH